MARIFRPAALAAGVLVLLAGSAGCSDIQNEIDAARPPESRPPASADMVSPGEPSASPTGSGRPWEALQSPCLPSGVRLGHDTVNGAMGLGAVTVTLTNCGTKPYEVNGYPEITVLDKDHDPLDVIMTHGKPIGGAKAPGPRPLTLAPGQSVRSQLGWNNRVTEQGSHQPGAYIMVAPAPGGERTELPLPLDIGSDGELDTTAWELPPSS